MTTAGPTTAMSDGADSTVLDQRLLAALFAAGFAALATLVFWPTVAAMAKAWLTSSTYHHGAFVAPLSLWLMMRRGALTAAPRLWLQALFAVAAGCAVWIIGHAATVNLIEQAAFVSLLIAGVALFFGPGYLRHWAFPLAFLFFMIPVGGSVLPALQDFAATGIVALLKMSGVETTLDGVMIATSGGRFEVAEACAGLNFLIAAMMVAALFSHLAFASWRKIAAFIAFSAVFALAANILRAYLVVLIATLTEGRIAIGADHLVFGLVFYGVLIVGLILVGCRFADRSDEKFSTDAQSEQSAPSMARFKPITLFSGAAALFAATIAYDQLVVDGTPSTTAPSYLPLMSAPGWRALQPAPEWQAPLSHADRVLHARYQTGIETVQLNAAYFTHDRRGGEIAGSDTRSYDGKDWRRIDRRKMTLYAFGTLRPVVVETLENASGAHLEAVLLYWLDDTVFTDPKALKLRQTQERLLGKHNRGGAVVVVAPADPPARGVLSIEAFLQSVEPLPAWLQRIDARTAE